jgi:SOUL heme-binding protein/Uncharacterized conserved protein (DUF2358)
MRSTSVTLLLLLCRSFVGTDAFSVAITQSHSPFQNQQPSSKNHHDFYATTRSSTPRLSASSSSISTTDTKTDEQQQIQNAVQNLKKVLYREYTSFFNPMEHDYYASDVTFVDPMTSFTGIAKYENNVDMLAGRTFMGKVLFKDAGIVLHKVEGGKVTISNNGNGAMSISNIVTRWTLRLTVQILPWQPTARFSGISVYTVQPGGRRGVQVIRQDDYWDSVNLLPDGGGEYAAMATSKGVADFLDQLKPNQMAAPSASSAELPYQLLRRGVDYEVRRYPAFCAVETEYTRRDEGYAELGAFCTGEIKPLAPALLQVTTNKSSKSMMWPLTYALPGASSNSSPAAPTNPAAVEKAQENAWKQQLQIVNIPERVVAVGVFSDATIEPIVRKAHAKLVQSCRRDGLVMKNVDQNTKKEDTEAKVLNFAQYDAIFSMGQRRSEVWIELEDGGHPW